MRKGIIKKKIAPENALGKIWLNKLLLKQKCLNLTEGRESIALQIQLPY